MIYLTVVCYVLGYFLIWEELLGKPSLSCKRAVRTFAYKR